MDCIMCGEANPLPTDVCAKCLNKSATTGHGIDYSAIVNESDICVVCNINQIDTKLMCGDCYYQSND